MTTSEVATVLAWHDALNTPDIDTLVNLSSDDVEVANADGALQGHDALRRWATSSRLSIVPGRMYVHDGVVVVQQQVRNADEGEWSTMASAFRIVHDKVTSVFRHDDLRSALAATELTEDDLTVDA